MSKLQLNPAFKPSEFLSSNWQREPILLPRLVPDFSDIIEPGELAGLACEEWVESRLITETAPGRWSVQHGPFDESVFTSLADTHWTLLVQAVDQYMEAAAELRSLFEFIPRWRIDDVMVSYAVEGGGVGPHFDHYDVFLLQGSGQRLWQVGGKLPPDTILDNQDGVGILPSFVAEHEFVLNPGDALYLPPQYAHWGRSIGASTCYSIGFRAPAVSEMLEGFSDELIASCLPGERFTDDQAQVPKYAAVIDPAAIQATFSTLLQRLDDPGLFARWFGAYVTQPKYPESREPVLPPLTGRELRQLLSEGRQLYQYSGSRFALLPLVADAAVLLFVDGEVFDLPSTYSDFLHQLCEPSLLNNTDFTQFEESDPRFGMIIQLLNQGSLLLR